MSDQLLAVNQEVFQRWMQEAEAQQDSAERGFSMGHRLLRLLAQQQEDTTMECHCRDLPIMRFPQVYCFSAGVLKKPAKI